MLVDFSIKNYLSIKDEQTLSFEAANINNLQEYYTIQIGKYKLLKMGILIGANASGKTNILKALEELRKLCLYKKKRDDPITRQPKQFLLDRNSYKKETKFKVTFLGKTDNCYKKFVYQIHFTKEKITFERLEFYPSIQPALIYERSINSDSEIGYDFKTGSKVRLTKNNKDFIENEILPNNSILSIFSDKNLKFRLAKEAYNWFKNYLLKIIFPKTNLIRYSMQFYYENPDYRKSLISFLKKADFNINHVTTKYLEDEISEEEFNKLQLFFSKEMVKGINKKQMYETNFTHFAKEQKSVIEKILSFETESHGTKRIFGLSAPLLQTLKRNKFIFIDELGSSLHFETLKYLILIFLKNSDKSQLLFTNHNLFLLDLDFIRKDVIWFTDKKENASTSLYSLIEFKGLKRINILKNYFAKNFGASPDIYDYDLELDK